MPEDGLTFTGMSYDNTRGLGADTWRHVAFIEQPKRLARQITAGSVGVDGQLRWLMSSDVCKHCTEAACLDVCPTGALFRTEFGTVVVQEDICNGCGYCVPACPYGVIDQRRGDGRVWKCTLCYDRLKVGVEPACAKACPTDSIQFGQLDQLRVRAGERVRSLRAAGVTDAAPLRRRSNRRRRRRRCVLPAARRTGGLRPTTRSRGHHPRPPVHVAQGRARGRRAGDRGVRGVRREAQP